MHRLLSLKGPMLQRYKVSFTNRLSPFNILEKPPANPTHTLTDLLLAQKTKNSGMVLGHLRNK